jgi:hypothetical protein
MQSKELSQFYNEIMLDMANNSSYLKDLESSGDFESLFAKLSQLGKEKGYNFSEKELRNALDSGVNMQNQELSDELLVDVAGGKTRSGNPPFDADGDGTGDSYVTDID